MEEKLYFKPSNYGKSSAGSSKKAGKNDKDEGSHRVRNATIFLAILGMLILVVYKLLNGKVTTSGEYPNPISNKSLTCEKKGLYRKISPSISREGDISIVMAFVGSTSLNKISLEYSLKYGSRVEIDGDEARAHFDFGEGLADNGLSFAEFSNKFSKIDNKLIVSLFGSQSDIADATRAKYFMIDIEKQGIPKSIKDFQIVYESQGFVCATPND